MSYVALDDMLFRQLCKMSFRFANPTFLRRLKGILQRCFQVAFYHCLENYIDKVSENSLCEMSYIPLYEMSCNYARYLLDLKIRHLLGVLKTSCQDVLSAFISHL